MWPDRETTFAAIEKLYEGPQIIFARGAARAISVLLSFLADELYLEKIRILYALQQDVNPY